MCRVIRSICAYRDHPSTWSINDCRPVASQSRFELPCLATVCGEREIIFCLIRLFVIASDDDAVLVVVHGYRKNSAARGAFRDRGVADGPGDTAIYRAKNPSIAASRDEKYPVFSLRYQASTACGKRRFSFLSGGHFVADDRFPILAIGGRDQDIMTVDRIGHRNATFPVPARDRIEECLFIFVAKLLLPRFAAVRRLVNSRVLPVADA